MPRVDASGAIGTSGSPPGEAEQPLSNPAQMALLLALKERGVPARTAVRGYSMHPFIRDQDVLTIEPLGGGTPHVGEVVAFAHPETGQLVMHRLVRLSGSGWLAKGDNCPAADGVITRDQIIGRITRVERKGREVRLGVGAGRGLVAVFSRSRARSLVRLAWTLPVRAAVVALRFLQDRPLFRRLARRWTPPVVVSEADDGKMERIHQRLTPFLPYHRKTWGPNVTNLVAERGGQVLGFVQLVYHPEDHYPWVGYWLFSLQVWEAYRGGGVGEKLTAAVIRTAAAKGAPELWLMVGENNRRAIRLYDKLGFSRTAAPALASYLASEKEKTGRSSIVMRKTLK